jgi:hypothetical protein
LFGGSELFCSLLDFGQVDTVEVSIIPVLSGSGVRLLPPPCTPARLRWHSHKICCSARVALAYEVRHWRENVIAPSNSSQLTAIPETKLAAIHFFKQLEFDGVDTFTPTLGRCDEHEDEEIKK